MDYRPREEEASRERTRESLIALSYCEPEKIADSTQAEKPNSKGKAFDELRSKLISITEMDSGSKAAGEVWSNEDYGAFLLNV